MKRSLLVGLLMAVLALGLAGCAQFAELPAGTVREFKGSAVVEQQEVQVPLPAADQKVMEYRVGPGDVLAISIPGMNPPATATKDGEQVQGYRVYGSGKVLLPMVGGVEVAGLTVDEVQAKLQKVFRPYIKEPVITVEILEFKSQPLYLLGKFNKPGVQYLDRPISLIQGITLGGGLTDSANLRGARLVRNNRIVPVDIYALMYNQDLQQNVQLRPGDTIYVPGNDQQNVFVLGAVAKEGPIPMVNGRLSLPQALATAGLGGKSYDPGHIRIIRSFSPNRGQLMVVDLGRIMAGEALPVALRDGDIVYVPRSGAGDWNTALGEILPTLQTMSAILQPFVQIKYLTDNTN